jgi:hypothetical protein
MIDLNLSAHFVPERVEEPPVLSEPWVSSFNETKVPVSARLFASNYNRIPARVVPV